MIDYKLTRSRRKTLSLQIERDLTLSVRAPLRTSRAAVDRFVQQHLGWIEKHRAILARQAALQGSFSYRPGDRFPLAGRPVVLDTGPVARPALEEDRLILPAGKDPEQALTAYLREQTRARVEAAIQCFAPLLGVAPTGLKITSAKTRWGSCSGRNSLCFSYRAACLSDQLLDYLVVHELAHILEHNHSHRFWALVRSILPDWEQRRARLREAGTTIPF